MQKDGLQSWLLCLACFFIWLCTFGFQFSFGIIFNELLGVFEESRSKTAWTGSLSTALSCLLAPLTMSLARHFREWQVMLCGVFGISSSLLLSSRATNIDELIVTLGVLYGIGSACLYPMTQTICKRCFDKRLSLCLGLSSTGSSLGPLILGPTLSKGFQMVGWRTTFQILAAIFTVLLLFSIACCYSVETETSPHHVKSNKQDIYSRYMAIFKHGPFMLYSTALAVICLQYVITHIHQVQYAVETGIPLSKASLIPTYMAVGNTIGRITFGFIFDLHFMDNLYLYQIIVFLTSATAFLGIFTVSYTHMIVYFMSLMILDGGFQGQTFHGMCLVIESSKVYDAWQILLMMQAGSILVGPPLLGLIVDKTQDYSSIFYVTGTPLAIGGILIFLTRCFKTRLPMTLTDDVTTKDKNFIDGEHGDELLDEDCLIYRESVL